MNDKKNNEFLSFILIGLVFFIIAIIFGIILENNKKVSTNVNNVKVKKEYYVPKLTYVEGLIERNLKDPDSYKRLDYEVKYNEEKISAIEVEYSATNSFGGRVRERYKFIFLENGKLMVEKIF